MACQGSPGSFAAGDFPHHGSGPAGGFGGSGRTGRLGGRSATGSGVHKGTIATCAIIMQYLRKIKIVLH